MNDASNGTATGATTGTTTGAGARILLPFVDDSTLFFVQRMRDLLAGRGHELITGWVTNDSDLSYRQLTAVLPNGPDVLLHTDAFRQATPLAEFDAIVTSRMFAALRDMIRMPHVRYGADRPAVIAFQGGLEFDPERGFGNRHAADAVFVVPQGDIDRYRKHSETADTGPQYLGFGHPTFLTPGDPPADLADRRDVYFFAQAISPPTKRARLHLLRMLAAIAHADPDRTVWLKLRHLPHENTGHLHREEYPYPSLMKEMGDLPANLKLTADPMDAVLDRAAVGITCTSTAAVDLVRAGVPALVYLDYVESYLDPLVPPMRRLFGKSGLVADTAQVLRLQTSAPDPAWTGTLFCPATRLAEQVEEAIAAFRARPVAVRRRIPPPDTLD